MSNRVKNSLILAILLIFLLIVELIPVTCIFKHVTGISCSACGMTRAFNSILSFDLYQAVYYNILSIPLFLFLIYSMIRLGIELMQNRFNYIPKLLKIFSCKSFLIILFCLLLFSFILNNLKG